MLLRRPGSVKNARADGQEGPPLIWWTALPAPPGVHQAPGREHVKTTLSPARGAIFTGHSAAFSHHFAFFLMLDVPIPSQTPLRGLTGHLKCPLVRHRDPHMLSETPFCTLQGPKKINLGITLVPTRAVLVPFWVPPLSGGWTSQTDRRCAGRRDQVPISRVDFRVAFLQNSC